MAPAAPRAAPRCPYSSAPAEGRLLRPPPPRPPRAGPGTAPGGRSRQSPSGMSGAVQRDEGALGKTSGDKEPAAEARCAVGSSETAGRGVWGVWGGCVCRAVSRDCYKWIPAVLCQHQRHIHPRLGRLQSTKGTPALQVPGHFPDTVIQTP